MYFEQEFVKLEQAEQIETSLFVNGRRAHLIFYFPVLKTLNHFGFEIIRLVLKTFRYCFSSTIQWMSSLYLIC